MTVKNKNLPKVKLPAIEPLQDSYHDGSGAYWGVARLIDFTENLKPFDCPLAALDLSREIWANSNMVDLAYHCKKVLDADLSKPIIISWNGAIADGRHRIIKAIINDKETIKAVRIPWRPSPCGNKND